MRASSRLYQLLIRLYPAEFRERYGTSLERDFKDEYGDVVDKGAFRVARFWARILWDLCRSVPQQLRREIGQDSRHALRLWRRRPLHTAFTVAVLAIAIGANTGVFSVLNALVLRSLPFADPHTLASLHMFPTPLASVAEFHGWRQESPFLADAAVYSSLEVNSDVVEDGRAARVRFTETSWNFFDLFGRQAIRGRTFTAGEDTPGQEPVAVIGYGLWQQQFGGDSRALGAKIRVNGAAVTIVGVAPPGFDYPSKTTVWTPTVFDFRRIPKTGVIFRFVVGRIKPGLTWAQAREAFTAEARHRSPDQFKMPNATPPALLPLQESLAGPVRQASFVLMGGVVLLLLMACANTANFMLGRTLSRANELSIRMVLGASRARLTQQLLTETVLLSALSAIVGVIVAVWVTRVATLVQPPSLASQAYSLLDWRVLGFAITIAFATGILFGIGPALYTVRAGVPSSSRTVTTTKRRTRLRNALIAAQIAVTIVLVAGSLVLGRAFVSLLSVNYGYDINSLATMSVSFAGTEYQQGDRATSYIDEVSRRVRQIPGVRSVSATEYLPLAIDGYMAGRFTVDHSGPETLATVVPIAPGYFATIGGRILAGREFSAADVSAPEPLTIVTEELARVFGDPAAVIGRWLTPARGSARLIIGVVQGLRDNGPTYTPEPQTFVLSRSPQSLIFVASVAGDARDQIARVRDAVASVDARVPVFNVRTMEERLEAVLARPKFYATAVVFFGGLATLLAVLGVYGVVSHAVVERLRELAIRLALGTTPAHVRRLLLGNMLVWVGAGAVPGLLITLATGRVLQNLIRGADTTASIGAVALLGTLGVSGLATWLATARLSRLDIMDILRVESTD
jgi:putative ABC transport system permease protein